MTDAELSGPHSYFIPMVDMLAGVVFILVILLASVTLVSREDFSSAQSAQQEIAEIQAELAAARALERDVLEPRRNAEAALRLLLSRLQQKLEARGMASEIDPSASRLVLAETSAFQPSGVALTEIGSSAAASVAAALESELPCLVPADGARSEDCAAYPPARLDRAVLAVSATATPGSGAQRSDARALGLLSAVVARAPDLLALRAVDGEELLAYRGLSAEAATTATAEGAVSATRLGTKPDRIVLAFQMDLPALPPAPSPAGP